MSAVNKSKWVGKMIIGRYDFLFRCHGCRTAVEHGGLAHASGGRAFESRPIFFLFFFLFFTSRAAFLIRSLKEVHLYLCLLCCMGQKDSRSSDRVKRWFHGMVIWEKWGARQKNLKDNKGKLFLTLKPKEASFLSPFQWRWLHYTALETVPETDTGTIQPPAGTPKFENFHSPRSRIRAEKFPSGLPSKLPCPNV